MHDDKNHQLEGAVAWQDLLSGNKYAYCKTSIIIKSLLQRAIKLIAVEMKIKCGTENSAVKDKPELSGLTRNRA